MAQARKRPEFHVHGRGEDMADQGLHRLHDLLFLDERHFHVDLGELGLAVGAQILVAETAGDLVITIHARNHENLFEQLRRLGQGEKVVGMRAARHQVVARAFGRGPGQQRRLHFEKAPFVEKFAHNAGETRAEPHARGHFRSAQVDIAVTQAHVFAYLDIFIDRNRRGLRAIQDFEFPAEHLHLAGGHVRVFGPRGPWPHLARDTNHEFVAHLLGDGETLRRIRIEHHLGDALAIPGIEENDAAVITPPMHPAAKRDFLPDQGFVHFPAIMTAHVFPREAAACKKLRIITEARKLRERLRLPRAHSGDIFAGWAYS